jgi:PST family polysaccharide transporter
MSRLTTNIGALYALQAANYILPLITLPYLVRVLGVSNFGLIAFSASLIQYFVVLTDYGFNLSATRDVAVSRDNPDRLGEVVSAVFAVKGILMVASALLLAAIVWLVSDYRVHWELYAATFLLVVGNVFFPVWLYQGLERMPVITTLNVLAKASAVAGIFLFVHSANDVVIAAALQSAGALLAGVISIFVLPRICPDVKLRIPSAHRLKEVMREGWHIFVSQLSANLVNNSNVLILGMFHGSHMVGQYAIAEKIVKAAISIQIPVCNAIYPRMGALFHESEENALIFLRKTLRYVAPIVVGASLALLFGADIVVHLIVGHPDDEVALLMRIMALLPITVFMDNLYGTQILLNIGRRSEFMRAVLYSGIFAISAALLTVPHFSAIASAGVYLASEVVLLILMVRYVHKAGLKLIGGVA